MKTFFFSFLSAALFFAFISCSDGGGGGGGDGGSNSDVSVPSCGNSVDGILQCAIEQLKEKKWDEAVAYYNKAYDKDNNNPKAVIYSVLANLAKISTDPKVVALMKDHFGFTTYPNKLNALLSDEWMEEYKEEYEDCYYDRNWRCTTEYDNIPLPVIRTPAWVTGKGSMYNDALLSGNVMSVENWAISLLANIIDKNSNGFNILLDDVIDGVFGSSYNLAVERLKKLENKKEDRIRLDPYFIEQLDLEDVFDEYDQIGWAEVNAVLSAMLLVKASLEYVQSYDLSIDLNWLKYSWKDNSDDMLKNFRNVDAKNLPFNNNFFNTRPGKMANSKADYLKAIRGFQSSYSSIVNSDLYPSKIKESYNTINGGFTELTRAIENSGRFYIPEDPTKGTWPTSQRNDVKVTVDFGKFFKEGTFALQNIFKTTSAGKPVFYLMKEICVDDYWWYDCEYEYIELNKSNYVRLIDDGGMLSLRLEVTPIDNQEDIIEYIPIGLTGEAAKILFGKYYP
ncbi:hypothetical protein R83H12_02132 [Fibrobacteria bacterium R8-3-H12]